MMMGWLDWLLGTRGQYASDQSERAFAPDAALDYWPLADRPHSNDKAYESLRRGGANLVHVETGNEKLLADFSGGLLLFATVWEPYSAKAIGNLCRQLDGDDSAVFGIVFFEVSRAEIREGKKNSWYFKKSYVLSSDSHKLRELIGRVPFRLFISPDGKICDTIEGKDW
jgi:hypothetical protein